MTKMFVHNCAHAALGSICSSEDALSVIDMAVQGNGKTASQIKFFEELGLFVFDHTGDKYKAEEAMLSMASILAMLCMAARNLASLTTYEFDSGKVVGLYYFSERRMRNGVKSGRIL